MERDKDNPDNLNRPDTGRTDRSDRGKENPGNSNRAGDIDRVDNMDTDLDSDLDDLDSEEDDEEGDALDNDIDQESSEIGRGGLPGTSDIRGNIDRGPESGRGSRGHEEEGGKITGI